jgi:hypothetical protein
VLSRDEKVQERQQKSEEKAQVKAQVKQQIKIQTNQLKEELKETVREPKMGGLLGIGPIWGDSSLHNTFDLAMNNLNGSSYNKGAFSFMFGLAFTYPFTPNVAISVEGNALIAGNKTGASKADSVDGLPKNSSDYVTLWNINTPLLLRFSTPVYGAFAAFFLEAGAQANMTFASNRDKESSSIFDYGYVAGIGVDMYEDSGTANGGPLIRYSYNVQGYSTLLVMLRLFIPKRVFQGSKR